MDVATLFRRPERVVYRQLLFAAVFTRLTAPRPAIPRDHPLSKPRVPVRALYHNPTAIPLATPGGGPHRAPYLPILVPLHDRMALVVELASSSQAYLHLGHMTL